MYQCGASPCFPYNGNYGVPQYFQPCNNVPCDNPPPCCPERKSSSRKNCVSKSTSPFRQSSSCKSACNINAVDKPEKKNENSANNLLTKLQKKMDHTMRGYFMHTMEKIERLSTQLLRNEHMNAKMHLDIVSKMNLLCKRNSAQFQAILSRIESIAGEPGGQSNGMNPGVKRSSTTVTEEDCEPEIDTNVGKKRRKNGSIKSKPGSKRASLQKSNDSCENQDPSPVSSKECDDAMDQNESPNMLGSSSSNPAEIECYNSCQEKIKCLQEALCRTLQQLEVNLLRIKDTQRSETQRQRNSKKANQDNLNNMNQNLNKYQCDKEGDKMNSASRR